MLRSWTYCEAHPNGDRVLVGLPIPLAAASGRGVEGARILGGLRLLGDLRLLVCLGILDGQLGGQWLREIM